MKTLAEFSELGDGFKISMRDLDFRGAGNLLGGEQSGFVTDIGFDAYHKLLDETIRELKETEFKELFATEVDVMKLAVDCNIETDVEAVFPEEYVQNITERLRLYNELDDIKDVQKLQVFEHDIQDRFGKIPEPVFNLIETVKLRWEASAVGFEKLKYKDGILKGYVAIENNDNYFQSEVFGKILTYIQTNPNRSSFREYRGKMIITIESVETVKDGIVVLQKMGE